MSPQPEVHIFANADKLAQAAAERFVETARQAIAQRGSFSAALAGGTTPQALYRLLAAPGFAPRVEWRRVHLFWGDERCVPPDDAQSNYRMAREAMLDHVPVPPENIHRIHGEAPPTAAAAVYEADLRAFWGSLPPQFDLILLGLGDDGHTASLFPGSQAVFESERWTAAVYVEKLAAWRVTLTPVVLNLGLSVIFLVAGAVKAAALQRVLESAADAETLPAKIIRPEDGNLIWMVDQPAARSLTNLTKHV